MGDRERHADATDLTGAVKSKLDFLRHFVDGENIKFYVHSISSVAFIADVAKWLWERRLAWWSLVSGFDWILGTVALGLLLVLLGTLLGIVLRIIIGLLLWPLIAVIKWALLAISRRARPVSTVFRDVFPASVLGIRRVTRNVPLAQSIIFQNRGKKEALVKGAAFFLMMFLSTWGALRMTPADAFGTLVVRVVGWIMMFSMSIAYLFAIRGRKRHTSPV